VARLALVPDTARGEVVVLPDAGAGERVPDADLVKRARGGDDWAHEMIYRRHVGLVAATAHRLLRDPADVDDVVQETFLIGFEQIGRLIDPGALRGWLVQIAVSRVHRRFRWRRLTGWLSGSEVAAALEDQASADASPEQRAELALIERALAKLPLKHSTPWVLRHVVGCGLDDIAAASGCSLATVKRRIADAEAAVARYLDDRAAETTTGPQRSKDRSSFTARKSRGTAGARR
jgi:RNA polymerase sigma-70 factor (ECF subfamily)